MISQATMMLEMNEESGEMRVRVETDNGDGNRAYSLLKFLADILNEAVDNLSSESMR